MTTKKKPSGALKRSQLTAADAKKAVNNPKRTGLQLAKKPIPKAKAKLAVRVEEQEGRFALVNVATGAKAREYTYKTAKAATNEAVRFGWDVTSK